LDYRFGFFSLFLKINGFFTDEEEEKKVGMLYQVLIFGADKDTKVVDFAGRLLSQPYFGQVWG